MCLTRSYRYDIIHKMLKQSGVGDRAMGQTEFNLLLENIDIMTAAVEKLPDNCREIVYRSLVDALLSDDMTPDVSSKTLIPQGSQSLYSHDVDERNIAEELENHYRQFGLDSVNDMEFAAFLGYFFAKLAPPNEITERIDESHYKMACMITGRNMPARISGTMNNAKNLKGYLESHGSGIYSISAMGEHYVKHRLLKEED